MNKTLSRVLWVIAGVLLIAAGVYCFVSPDAALSGLSLMLGLAMLFSGVVDIVIFATSTFYAWLRLVSVRWYLYRSSIGFSALQSSIYYAFLAIYFWHVAAVRRYQPVCQFL